MLSAPPNFLLCNIGRSEVWVFYQCVTAFPRFNIVSKSRDPEADTKNGGSKILLLSFFKKPIPLNKPRVEPLSDGNLLVALTSGAFLKVNEY